jgi:hypothetical protein
MPGLIIDVGEAEAVLKKPFDNHHLPARQDLIPAPFLHYWGGMYRESG